MRKPRLWVTGSRLHSDTEQLENGNLASASFLMDTVRGMQVKHLPGNGEQNVAHLCGEKPAGPQRHPGPPDRRPVSLWNWHPQGQGCLSVLITHMKGPGMQLVPSEYLINDEVNECLWKKLENPKYFPRLNEEDSHRWDEIMPATGLPCALRLWLCSWWQCRCKQLGQTVSSAGTHFMQR